MIRARFCLGANTEIPIEFTIEHATAQAVADDIQEVVEAMQNATDDDDGPKNTLH